eukprot:gene9703-7570_t
MSEEGPIRGASASPSWSAWLDDSLGDLKQRNLLRSQHPTIPLKSSTTAQIDPWDLAAWASGVESPIVNDWEEAQINPRDLAAWASGVQAPIVNDWDARGTSTTRGTPQLHTLRLFSLNDYLGLGSHPEVCQAAATALLKVGMGPRSSAIVGGTTTIHRELECALADLKGTEDCLLFPSGFAANMCVVTALMPASGAPIKCFAANMCVVTALMPASGAPIQLLKSSEGNGSRRLVITDSLFSMDGDFADLKAIAKLKERYNFLLAVDEAHATLVCGERGGGAAEAMHVEDQVDLHIGTLSKAFGALGALPIPVVSAALASLRVSQR